jgi:murein DD-endopeptidase MepM/ murein hydrolase activator NlpD
MGKGKVARRGAGVARSIILFALLLAACGPREPAPVISESPPPPVQVIVQRGQTLSGIAQENHVPMRVVAQANHLSPPYRILVGQALIIPGASQPASYGPSVAMATAPTSSTPPPIGVPLPSPERTPVQPTPLDHSPPASSGGPPAAAAPPPAALTPPVSVPASPTAENPAPPKGSAPESASSAAKGPRQQPSAAPGPTAAAEPPPAAAHGGGSFLWPVRGHVLENYGAGPDGTHNDGINIAAARGAPVQAADAGVVAYSGNELRGYGNLILIKHANGWISAYAHCDLVLVKSGQKVARGQVIARVGSTGSVSEPQLHFELRRGKRPVDPREYLTPLPTAATAEAHPS